MFYCCFFETDGDHRYLHVLTTSFPTRRSSDLTRSLDAVAAGPAGRTRQGRTLMQVLLIGCGRMGSAMARGWRGSEPVLVFDPMVDAVPEGTEREIGRAHV